MGGASRLWALAALFVAIVAVGFVSGCEQSMAPAYASRIGIPHSAQHTVADPWFQCSTAGGPTSPWSCSYDACAYPCSPGYPPIPVYVDTTGQWDPCSKQQNCQNPFTGATGPYVDTDTNPPDSANLNGFCQGCTIAHLDNIRKRKINDALLLMVDTTQPMCAALENFYVQMQNTGQVWYWVEVSTPDAWGYSFWHGDQSLGLGPDFKANIFIKDSVINKQYGSLGYAGDSLIAVTAIHEAYHSYSRDDNNNNANGIATNCLFIN